MKSVRLSQYRFRGGFCSESVHNFNYCDSIIHSAPKPELLPLPPNDWIPSYPVDINGVTRHLKVLLKLQTG